ncbi:MAG: hypothetical protein A4S17_00705 [Proteobacteria bacterium HN_bin10]|nr:MAG: hypothetical protein A4S17_00705 [Proteobacteria bacterium HN_bin10]
MRCGAYATPRGARLQRGISYERTDGQPLTMAAVVARGARRQREQAVVGANCRAEPPRSARARGEEARHRVARARDRWCDLDEAARLVLQSANAFTGRRDAKQSAAAPPVELPSSIGRSISKASSKPARSSP